MSNDLIKSTPQWKSLWAQLESILDLSNLKFDPETRKIKEEGTKRTLDAKTKDKLVISIMKLLKEMEGFIKDQEKMKEDFQEPNTFGEPSQDEPNDSKRTIIKIGGDKIKIKMEPKSKRDREDEEDDEQVEMGVSLRKKAKIKLENDEDEDKDGFHNSESQIPAEHESQGEIPSVYENLPPLNFHMKELVDMVFKILELYDDEENKATSKGFADYWKKKCAVSFYPETDLKDDLPGEIPMTDFSGPKPGNQISFTTFMGYIEGFFRNYNEDDLRWLSQKTLHSSNLFSAINPPPIGPDGSKILTGGVQPYDPVKDPQYIPQLGANYQDVWNAENEGKQVRLNKLQMLNAMKVKKQLATPLGEPSSIKGSTDEYDTKVSTGPLTSRLLSAILPDEETVTKDYFNEEDQPIDGLEVMTFEQIEERVKRELNYVGVFMNVKQKLNQDSWDQDWGLFKEDDEVCREIRDLQRELKMKQVRNVARKAVLIPKVKEQIAWQEYIMIVDDLDKQVEQHYRRRIGVLPKKSSKKKIADDKEDVTHLVTNSSFKGLLDKRRRWIEKIGPLFKSNVEMRRMPTESIFKSAIDQLTDGDNGEDNGEDEDDEDVDAEQHEEVNADQL